MIPCYVIMTNEGDVEKVTMVRPRDTKTNPKPYTQNSYPIITIPKPYTMKAKAETHNPTPEIVIPNPSTQEICGERMNHMQLRQRPCAPRLLAKPFTLKPRTLNPTSLPSDLVASHASVTPGTYPAKSSDSSARTFRVRVWGLWFSV